MPIQWLAQTEASGILFAATSLSPSATTIKSRDAS